MRTENALKKPQHAWIRDIDNSYNVFVPALKEKVHYFNTPALPAKVSALQKLKAENPDDFRCIVRLGEHNKHKD